LLKYLSISSGGNAVSITPSNPIITNHFSEFIVSRLAQLFGAQKLAEILVVGSAHPTP
jgi:hypothetical protein